MGSCQSTTAIKSHAEPTRCAGPTFAELAARFHQPPFSPPAKPSVQQCCSPEVAHSNLAGSLDHPATNGLSESASSSRVGGLSISPDLCVSSPHQVIGHYKLFDALDTDCPARNSLVVSCADTAHPRTEHYAAKVIPKNGPNGTQAAMKEVTIHSQLKHRGIVGFVDYFELPDAYVLVLEAVDGGNLLTLLRALPQQRMSEADARKYFVQIVRALVYLQSLGIAHGDIKLENVVCRSDGSVALCDFGAAEQLESGQKMLVRHNAIATVDYAAPEVLACQCHDPFAADVWSLGVLLHTMVSGSLPFTRDEDDSDTCENVLLSAYQVPDEASPALAHLLFRMIGSKDVAHRITLGELLQDAWLAGE